MEPNLRAAAKAGNIKSIRELLPQIENINEADEHGWTALMLASASLREHPEVVTELLSAGADVDLQNEDKYTALMVASKKGYTKVMNILIAARADKDTQDQDEKTALMLACESEICRPEVVKLLLQAGAATATHDEDGKNALMLASQHGHADIVKLLIPAGIFKDEYDKDEKTALMLASEKGNDNVVQLLMAAGANKDAKDKDGKTALHLACQKGHLSVASLLVAAVENKDARDEDGKTALMLAAERGYWAVMKILINAGVDTKLMSKDEKTAFMLAAEKGKTVVVQGMMTGAVVDIHATGKNGRTALMLASQFGHADISAMLLSAGAGINAQGKDGWTALMCASMYGRAAVVTLLLAAGADVYAKSSTRKTALDLAKTQDIKNLLQPHYATALMEAGATSAIGSIHSSPVRGSSATAGSVPATPAAAPISGPARTVPAPDSRSPEPVPGVTKAAIPLAPASPFAAPGPPALSSDLSLVTTALGSDAQAMFQHLRGECDRLLTQAAYAVRRNDLEAKFSAARDERNKTSARAIRREQEAFAAKHALTLSEDDYRALPNKLRELAHRLFDFSVEYEDAPDQVDELQLAVEDVLNLLASSASPSIDPQVASMRILLENILEKVDKIDDKLDKVLEVLTKGFKALGSTVVDVAKRLRMEIQEGNQQAAYVLPAMIQATQDAVTRLSSPQCQNSAEMHDCMTAMQTQVEAAISRALAEQKGAGAKEVGALAVELRGRFSEISTELHKHFQEQRAGSADAAKQVADLNLSLKTGLEEVLCSLSVMNAKLDTMLLELRKGFKEISSNTAEIGESLRREIILGNEQAAKVLPDMITVAKEAKENLEKLFRWRTKLPEPATVSAQIQECMSTMQANIQAAVDRALAEQGRIQAATNRELAERKTADAANFSAIAAQLQGKFAELNAGLMEHLQEQRQSTAQTRQQLDDLKLTGGNMKAGIVELLKGLEDVNGKLDVLKQNQKILGEKLTQVLVEHAELGAMVRTLSKNTHGMPTYAMILPVVANGWARILKAPLRLVHQQYRLYFICAHTNQIAPCGPKGDGYKITMTRQWVLDAAPVLRVGLVLVKVALLASGLPLPVPDVCAGLTDTAMHSKYLDAALQFVSNPPADSISTAEFVLDTKLNDVKDHDYSDYKAAGAEKRLQQGSQKAYETIKEILGKDKVNVPLTCGLRQVTHRGKTAWVLDNDATEQAWKAAAAGAAKRS